MCKRKLQDALFRFSDAGLEVHVFLFMLAIQFGIAIIKNASL